MLHYQFPWLTVSREMSDVFQWNQWSCSHVHVTTGSLDIWIIRYLGCWGCLGDENWRETPNKHRMLPQRIQRFNVVVPTLLKGWWFYVVLWRLLLRCMDAESQRLLQQQACIGERLIYGQSNIWIIYQNMPF